MPKKRKQRKRPVEKPLLAVTGILHLEKSFIPPTHESGLLNTVGGGNLEGQALVLAPNYGYGISASAVAKVLENQQKNLEIAPTNVVEMNGVKLVTSDKNLIELNHEYPMNPKTKDDPVETRPEELSIAELVRSIGGAKDKPFMRSDVLDEAEGTEKDPIDIADEKENVVEENEFYESIGILKKNGDAQATPTQSKRQDAQIAATEKNVPESDNTKSIADYYKTYCRYYFSAEPDPLSDKPLEFGKSIQPEDGTDNPHPDQSIIELAQMAQRARRAMEAAQMAAKTVYGPHLPTRHEENYDPLPMEIVPSETPGSFVRTARTSMIEYWEYVKENPRDFNRWTYLVQHAENTKNLIECRKAYSAFLPLFPYCFGYWKRYSEIEKGRLYYQRALSILLRGLEFNPLSIDLWQSYLSLFREIYGRQEGFQGKMRNQYERALASAGLEFRSDAIWDEYIDWELNCKNMKKAFALYRRILMVPTRLYNRHWDNFKALVRDHHPRDFLEKSEYELLRKKGCKILGFRYKEEPEVEPGEIIKTSKPEDKLMNYVKEKVTGKLEKSHKKLAVEADKRWDYEDKIKRPYFHIKPLDNGQLRNWENYLQFEISEGNHDRVVLLFERCLIACALYDRFWCKYARYLEKFHRQECNKNEKASPYFQKSSISFEIATKKEIMEEEELVATVTEVLKGVIDRVVANEEEERHAIHHVVNSLIDKVCDLETEAKRAMDSEYLNFVSFVIGEPEIGPMNTSSGYSEVNEVSVGLSGDSQSKKVELPPNSVEPDSNDNDVSSLTSVLSVPVFPRAKLQWQEMIRDVYKRACVVHCPRKPVLRLQWAAFEEEIGNTLGARQLIHQVLDWFPDIMDAKSQLIELERRANKPEEVIRLFEKYLGEKRNARQFSMLSMKYARYLYKEQGKPDQALSVLRKAVRRDKGNHLLYAYVFDICYQRFPSDRKGAAAALELALQSKDIDKESKLFFLRKKVLFLQEHGELANYRDSLDQLYELQDEVAKTKAAAEAIKAQEQLAVMATYSHPQPVYQQSQNPMSQGQVPIDFESLNAVTAPLDQRLTEEDSRYKSVPPTEELSGYDLSSYGYHRNHPDFKMQENLYQSEYDKLVSRGYSQDILDKDKCGPPKNLKRKSRDIPTYIVPPRGEFLSNYLHSRKSRSRPSSATQS